MTTDPSETTSVLVPAGRPHPAKYSRRVLDALQVILDGELVGRPRSAERLLVVDPFAGTGLIHTLASESIRTIGVELEAEWAEQHDSTIVGSALELVHLFGERGGFPYDVDVIATSPCFGNRMADSHDAKDVCNVCIGSGVSVDDAGGAAVVCEKCDGDGLSPRNTYRAKLGRAPSEGSAAVLQWGRAYREFHREFVRQCIEVLPPGGLLAVNMKNHIRDGRVMQVVVWWLAMMLAFEVDLDSVVRLDSAGNRFGSNGAARVDSEFWLCVRIPRSWAK
jgi:hypothetical protein